MKKERGQML